MPARLGIWRLPEQVYSYPPVNKEHVVNPLASAHIPWAEKSKGSGHKRRFGSRQIALQTSTNAADTRRSAINAGIQIPHQFMALKWNPMGTTDRLVAGRATENFYRTEAVCDCETAYIMRDSSRRPNLLGTRFMEGERTVVRPGVAVSKNAVSLAL